MPATQNFRLADWHETPFLNGTHDLEVDQSPFYPETLESCTEFVLGQALPQIAAYDGYESLQQEMATEIAQDIYEEGRDAVQALAMYLRDSQRRDNDPYRSIEQLAQDTKKSHLEKWEGKANRPNLVIVVAQPIDSLETKITVNEYGQNRTAS